MKQSVRGSINRFFTSPSWNLDNVMKCAQEIIFSTVRHDDNLEFLIIDDTVCKKYGTQSEMVCYNHSTVLGTGLSHDYVTGFYMCGDVCLPSSARLYGNPKKCDEKGIPFRTKIQLCNEIIGEHRPIARKTVTLIDSWYTGNEVISKCRKQGYGWIGDLKSNRIVLYDGKSMHVLDLLNILRKGGQFTDTVIDGQIYQTVKVMAYIPSLKENVSIVINAKADTKDIHVRCTDLQEDVSTIIRYAQKRVRIENSYKDAKAARAWRVQVQKERSGAYTRAPSLSGIYSPANSQIQTAFVQDNKGSAVNGICHDVGQKENQTGIHPLHMEQIKTRNINTFAHYDC